jgi:hypothetical protein
MILGNSNRFCGGDDVKFYYYVSGINYRINSFMLTLFSHTNPDNNYFVINIVSF